MTDIIIFAIGFGPFTTDFGLFAIGKGPPTKIWLLHLANIHPSK